LVYFKFKVSIFARLINKKFEKVRLLDCITIKNPDHLMLASACQNGEYNQECCEEEYKFQMPTVIHLIVLN